MKGFFFSISFLFAASLNAQVLQRSQGFPADPVTALSWCDDTLYIGTQGSGVFMLVEQRILPSRRFNEFSRSIIYDFENCEPVTSGTLQAYPIIASSPDGTTYTAEDGFLRIEFTDEGSRIDKRPSGIWHFPDLQMAPYETGLTFIRNGPELSAYAQNDLIDVFIAKGLIFDVASTPFGLLLSTEAGLYRWEKGWQLRYEGLPIFAFDGPTVRTPLGVIALEKLLEGDWAMDDFSSPTERSPAQEPFFDVDTIGNTYYGFGPNGLEVFDSTGALFSITSARGLPAMGPGSYDVALNNENLFVATPKGLWVFLNEGKPNDLRDIGVLFWQNGLRVDSFEDLEISPTTIGFTVLQRKVSAGKVYGRYRLNAGAWESFSVTERIILERPAPQNYTLEIQTSTRLDFAQGMNAKYAFTVRAPWYKRIWPWVAIVLGAASILLLRQRKTRIRLQERLQLQERLADAELASKRLQMNPHFLFNALDAISNFIFKNQPKDAVKYMGKLAKMMRLTLDSSRSEAMVLADEMELINQYLDLCKLRYGNFDVQWKVDENLDTFDHYVPPMLLQPVVENAVQHALRPVMAMEQVAVLCIKVTLHENRLCIAVEDNGPGMPAEVTSSGSHGLAIIKERLDLLSKKYGQTFEKHIEPLTESTSSTGIRVSLIIPSDFGH
ncbi:MAG: histidine kinase [Schleiferiaceae bacterium]|nr:histidine kinase [Schleiferiaceae bacterium]